MEQGRSDSISTLNLLQMSIEEKAEKITSAYGLILVASIRQVRC